MVYDLRQPDLAATGELTGFYDRRRSLAVACCLPMPEKCRADKWHAATGEFLIDGHKAMVPFAVQVADFISSKPALQSARAGSRRRWNFGFATRAVSRSVTQPVSVAD